jgi:signal transduction histidine kinase
MDLAHYASESVIVYDLDGNVRYCNPASESLYGWMAEAMTGRNVKNFTNEPNTGGELWRVLLQTGKWQGTVRRRPLHGAEVVAMARYHVRLDNGGAPLDVVEYSAAKAPDIVSQAIKDAAAVQPQKRAACWQFNIHRARALLAGIDAAGAAAEIPEWHQDRLERMLAEVRIIDINEEAIRLFGLLDDLDRLLARPIANLWPEDSRAMLADLLVALAAKTDAEAETRAVSSLGRLRDVVLTGWRAADPRCADTIFIYVSGTMNAPSAVRELEASQDRYRNLISSLPLPVWQIDARAAGRIFERLREAGITDMASYSESHPELVDLACEIVLVSEVNKEAIALFGANDRSELTGPISYVFAGTPGSARRVMLAHFAGVRNYVEELKVRTLDGGLRDVLLLVTFPVPGERLDTTIIIMVDNTARLQAEARLRQVQADFTHAARLSTLGEMTTSIAHEIKQPLSAILTNAQTSLRWLSRAEPNVEKATQLAARIAESAQRANDIIGRIQDMAGKRAPSRGRLNLNDVVRQCLVFLRHESDDKSVTINVELEPALPDILGDRIQLQQIVVNLIVNSIQAMRPAEQKLRAIFLTTSRHVTDGVVFSIRDTGSGIAEDQLSQVFEGFFTTKENGLGIGLAICQSIISAHGGTIAASNHPDGGAVFRFAIPAETSAVDALQSRVA